MLEKTARQHLRHIPRSDDSNFHSSRKIDHIPLLKSGTISKAGKWRRPPRSERSPARSLGNLSAAMSPSRTVDIVRHKADRGIPRLPRWRRAIAREPWAA